MGYKIKSHSGAKKRFSKTASGRIKTKKSRTRHLKLGKSNSRLRRYNTSLYLQPEHAQRVAPLIPYL